MSAVYLGGVSVPTGHHSHAGPHTHHAGPHHLHAGNQRQRSWARKMLGVMGVNTADNVHSAQIWPPRPNNNCYGTDCSNWGGSNGWNGYNPYFTNDGYVRPMPLGGVRPMPAGGR